MSQQQRRRRRHKRMRPSRCVVTFLTFTAILAFLPCEMAERVVRAHVEGILHYGSSTPAYLVTRLLAILVSLQPAILSIAPPDVSPHPARILPRSPGPLACLTGLTTPRSCIRLVDALRTLIHTPRRVPHYEDPSRYVDSVPVPPCVLPHTMNMIMRYFVYLRTEDVPVRFSHVRLARLFLAALVIATRYETQDMEGMLGRTRRVIGEFAVLWHGEGKIAAAQLNAEEWALCDALSWTVVDRDSPYERLVDMALPRTVLSIARYVLVSTVYYEFSLAGEDPGDLARGCVEVARSYLRDVPCNSDLSRRLCAAMADTLRARVARSKPPVVSKDDAYVAGRIREWVCGGASESSSMYEELRSLCS